MGISKRSEVKEKKEKRVKASRMPGCQDARMPG